MEKLSPNKISNGTTSNGNNNNNGTPSKNQRQTFPNSNGAPVTNSSSSSQRAQNIQLNNSKLNNSTTNDEDGDEVKVYNEEGAADEEQRNSESLTEEKTEIVKETAEEKASSGLSSHPFSVNNLMLYNGAAAAAASQLASLKHDTNPFSAAAAAAAFGYRQPFYNPALYPTELFASWWPAAAAAGAAFYNSAAHHNAAQIAAAAASPSFPFSPAAAFSAAAAAANYQQQQYAAALSRFSPSLFLPPPPGAASPSTTNGGANLLSSSSSVSSASSAGSTGPGAATHNPHNMASSSPFNVLSNNSRHHNTNNHHNLNGTQNSKGLMNGHGMSGMHGNRSKPLNGSLNASNPNGLNIHQPPPPSHLIQQKPKKPHIKKPLNAFMLFMKEQRAQVVSECTLRESAAINQILGRKWHELERSEQAKYYEMARQERLKHMQDHPGWSARDNYGLKKKRRRKREKVIGENGTMMRYMIRRCRRAPQAEKGKQTKPVLVTPALLVMLMVGKRVSGSTLNGASGTNVPITEVAEIKKILVSQTIGAAQMGKIGGMKAMYPRRKVPAGPTETLNQAGQKSGTIVRMRQTAEILRQRALEKPTARSSTPTPVVTLISNLALLPLRVLS